MRTLRSPFAAALRGALIAVLVLFTAACTSTPAAPTTAAPPPAPDAAATAALGTRIQEGDFAALSDYRRGWLALPDVTGRLARMDELERQALQMFDQPLRMGAIGAALLEVYPASLTGHLASAAYYERVGATAEAERFRARTKAIADVIAAAPNGGAAEPRMIAVLTLGEGSAYLRHIGVTPLGSIYGAPRDRDLTVTVIGSEGKDKPLVTTTFDLSDAYRARRAGAPPLSETGGDVRSQALQSYLGERSREGDSAARTFLAMTMLGGDPQWRGYARTLLQQAVGDGNLYARLLLVQSLLADYERTSEEQRPALAQAVVRQLEQAVAAGSEVAMLQLGRVQISDLLGPEGAAERRAEGLAHVRRSAELKHVPAMMLLAALYAQGGDIVAKDLVAAREWLARAGAEGDTGARIGYIRMMLAEQPPVLDERARGWLDALVGAEEPDGLFLAASLHARGEHLPLDLARTRKLFDRIVELVPTAGEQINNVAWTLAVSDIAQLRDAKRALSIMTTMMTKNEDAARTAAYIDTWAATHAAAGQFERAIELQQQAISAAEAEKDDASLPILREHLEAFRRGETITEKVP